MYNKDRIQALCFLSLFAMIRAFLDTFRLCTSSWWRSKSVLSSFACLLASFWPHEDFSNFANASAAVHMQHKCLVFNAPLRPILYARL